MRKFSSLVFSLLLLTLALAPAVSVEAQECTTCVWYCPAGPMLTEDCETPPALGCTRQCFDFSLTPDEPAETAQSVEPTDDGPAVWDVPVSDLDEMPDPEFMAPCPPPRDDVLEQPRSLR